MAQHLVAVKKAGGGGLEGQTVYVWGVRDDTASGADSGVTYLGELTLLKDKYDATAAAAKTAIRAGTMALFIDVTDANSYTLQDLN